MPSGSRENIKVYIENKYLKYSISDNIFCINTTGESSLSPTIIRLRRSHCTCRPLPKPFSFTRTALIPRFSAFCWGDWERPRSSASWQSHCHKDGNTHRCSLHSCRLSSKRCPSTGVLKPAWPCWYPTQGFTLLVRKSAHSVVGSGFYMYDWQIFPSCGFTVHQANKIANTNR
jgi:hypothetical protein